MTASRSELTMEMPAHPQTLPDASVDGDGDDDEECDSFCVSDHTETIISKM